jgi:hypothetical protein
MNMGEFAWLHIAQHLAEDKTTLQQAVDKANSDIDKVHWIDTNGNPLPAVHWTVVGDRTIQFY